MTLDNNKLEDISKLKTLSNSVLNGFGNIYKIGLDKLEWLINKKLTLFQRKIIKICHLDVTPKMQ